MIIPIKCVSCGNVIADKYRYYLEQVRKKKKEEKVTDKVIYYTKNMENTQTIECQVLDNLKLNKVCCRRIMLTHVDIE
jgi:DNA-directed RNA polymerase I, II, and III subunit RPABC5